MPLRLPLWVDPLLILHTILQCPRQTNLTWLDLSFNKITKIEVGRAAALAICAPDALWPAWPRG